MELQKLYEEEEEREDMEKRIRDAIGLLEGQLNGLKRRKLWDIKPNEI